MGRVFIRVMLADRTSDAGSAAPSGSASAARSTAARVRPRPARAAPARSFVVHHRQHRPATTHSPPGIPILLGLSLREPPMSEAGHVVPRDRAGRAARGGDRGRPRGPRLKAGEFIVQATRMVEEQWMPANGARVVAKAWTDPAFRQRLLAERPRRRRRARHRDAAPPPAPGGAGEHADGAQRHLLHAVLVHRLHRHRLAARLVQGPRVPGARRARVAHRAAGDGARPAAGDRDPGLGHHRRHPLHGAAACGRRDTAGWTEESWRRSSRRIR